MTRCGLAGEAFIRPRFFSQGRVSLNALYALHVAIAARDRR